ncbi:putative RNA-binding protein EIF1AD [Armadillidium vulgare]|nr:putative RNA-binding protein EIF1AD [Armadillidium vulgare]
MFFYLEYVKCLRTFFLLRTLILVCFIKFLQVVTPSGEEFLVSMPPKFRKHIWVKRGSYVIAEEIPEGNKVKAEIVRILLQDQIKYFKENSVWPEAFNDEENALKNYKIDEDLLPKSSDSDDDDSDGETATFVQYNPNKYLPPHALNNSESDSDNTDDESEVSDSDESEKADGDESSH